MVRFNSPRSTPPDGCYEYSAGGELVSSKNRNEIAKLTRDLRVKHGLPVIGDPFRYVMEYMCPSLPDGFCTAPSTVRPLRVAVVKEKTAALFPRALAINDEIERRMACCVECPKQTRRGFCVTCTGLLDWIYRGFSGKRGKLPADAVLGVCLCDEVLAAAGASVASRPLSDGVEYPETCWRLGASRKEPK